MRIAQRRLANGVLAIVLVMASVMGNVALPRRAAIMASRM